MADWRRKPAGRVVVHSDQASQYGSDDLKRSCHTHNLEPSMSRRANFWDNAVAESSFSSLKKERIRRRIYKTRDLARAHVFDCIEAFYNRTRRHSHLDGASTEAFESAAAGGWELSANPGAVHLAPLRPRQASSLSGSGLLNGRIETLPSETGQSASNPIAVAATCPADGNLLVADMGPVRDSQFSAGIGNAGLTPRNLLRQFLADLCGR